ncbi:MAG: hypothetical protein U0R69_14540 [Gaiellales bacterium]
MSDLGDLLLALHGGPRFHTVRGTVRSWSHHARSLEAFRRRERSERHGTSASSISFYGGPVDEPGPESSETLERIWFELPDRARSETEHVYRSHTSRSTVVIQGDTWWSLQDGEAATNAGDPRHQHGLGSSVQLLAPTTWALASSTLVPLGATTVAGRPCLRAEVRPQPWSVLSDYQFAVVDGAGQEIDVDSERGVVLRHTQLLDGEPYAIEEFTEIVFDEALDPALFRFEPPPGVEVHTTTTGRAAPVPLYEVVREAGFTVLAARTVPSGWELSCHHVEASKAGPELVFLHYAAGDASARVSVSEHASGEPEPAPTSSGWRPFHGDYRTWEPSPDDWPMQRQVAFEREGTAVRLVSAELDLEALAEFAETFAPASAEPPRPG